LLFSVAFCAVEPLPTAWRADGDLGVEDVFAGGGVSQAHKVAIEGWNYHMLPGGWCVWCAEEMCGVSWLFQCSRFVVQGIAHGGS